MKITRVTCCLFLLLLFLVAFAFVPRSQASAASGRVTQGDVVAILHAGWSAGIVFVHAIGFTDYPRATITPLSSLSGTHYCVDDWHVERITFQNSVDNVFFFTKEQAIADLQATSITLTLDGVPLPVTQTPIVEINAADQQLIGFPGPTFQFQTGSIFSPTAISVGDHTAGLVSTDPVFGPQTDSSTFTVDPSGTGACLQG